MFPFSLLKHVLCMLSGLSALHPPPPHFLSSWSHFLLCSPPLLLFLFFNLPSCSFDSSEGNYDESGWAGTKSAFPSSNERTNYSLPFFILNVLFLFFFQVVTKPMLFLQVLKDLKIFMNIWPWLAHLPNTNSWNVFTLRRKQIVFYIISYAVEIEYSWVLYT